MLLALEGKGGILAFRANFASGQAAAAPIGGRV